MQRETNRISPESVFRDAAAAWHMSGGEDLEAAGAVETGIALSGPEREASVRRGGDGVVARFDGGGLVAGRRHPMDWGGCDEMTVCLRMRDPGGGWDAPVLSLFDSGQGNPPILRGATVDAATLNSDTAPLRGNDRAVEFVWRTQPLSKRVRAEFFGTAWYEALRRIAGDDLDKGILRLGVPVERIGPTDWHDIVIRFRRACLECFVDGVLVDEEWPQGTLEHFSTPFLIGAGCGGEDRGAFCGLVDHLAVWKRALRDDEVAAICGGEEWVACRDRKCFGEASGEMQYWLPRGYNTFVGDCMPFYHEGEFHLYYLFDRRRHKSKWGMGAHQFAHASSKDLVHWKHHPMALPITDPWECSIGTGGVCHRDGEFRAFYIHHGKRGYFRDAPHRGETLHVAVGRTPQCFSKRPDPIVPIDYRGFDDVNPDIFPNASGTGWHLSVSGWKVFDSPDLKTWSENDDFESPRDLPNWICCSVFEWNGWHYFAGSGNYRMSREAPAPGWHWSQPEYPATRDGLGVPKIAAFSVNRYLLAGFFGPGFGGELVFRELVQHADGTLGTKFPPEMIPACHDPIHLADTFSDGEGCFSGQGVTLDAVRGFAYGGVTGVPRNTRITLRMHPGPGTRAFGLCFRGAKDALAGLALRFDPRGERVELVPVENGRPFAAPVRDIGGVGGLTEPFPLDIIVKNNFVDVCLDERRTLIARIPDSCAGDRILLFVEEGRVTFRDFCIRELVHSGECSNSHYGLNR